MITKFSAELRSARAAAGLTQAELAALLNVEQATVSRWERGSEPSLENMVMIAKVFEDRDVEFNYLNGLLHDRALVEVGRIRHYVPFVGKLYENGELKMHAEIVTDQHFEAPPAATAATVCIQVACDEYRPFFPRDSLLYFEDFDEAVPSTRPARDGEFVACRTKDGQTLIGEIYESGLGKNALRTPSGVRSSLEVTVIRKIRAARIR